MNELRMVKGTDLELYADDEPLFGVTAFSASKKQRYHEIYEYLCAKPCERIPQGTYYALSLKVMALFDRQLPTESEFSLRVKDGAVSYCYHGCNVTGQSTEVQGNTHAAEVITIEAESMEKRAEDE